MALRKILFLACGIAVLLLFWQMYSSFYPEMRYVIPPPSAILASCVERFPRLLFHTYTTMKTVFLSLMLSSILSLPLAFLLYRFTSLSLFLQVCFVLLESLPTFCIAPILIMWLGWGTWSALLPCILSALVSQTLILWRALRNTPSHYQEYFSTLGASSWARFWKLEFPCALPSFFSGMRIAAAISGVSAIASEWAGQEAGLGVLILEAREEVDMAGCFAALLGIFSLSGLMYVLTVCFEKMVSFCCSFSFRRAFGVAFLSLFAVYPLMAQETYSLMLDWMASPTHVPLFAGEEWQLFQEEGIPLKIMKPSLIDPLQLLLSGKVDLALSHMPHVLRLKATGLPIEIVGTLIQKPLNGFMAHKKHCLFQGAGSGVVVGFMGGSFSSRSLYALLEESGWSRATTVQLRSDLVSRFLSGAVDVAYGVFRTIEPLHCQSLGEEVSFVGVEELGFPPYHELVVISLPTGKLLQEGKREAFQRAIQKSIDRSLLQDSDAFQAYLRHFPDKSERTRSWEQNAWLATKEYFSKDQNIPSSMLDDLLCWYEQHGILKAPAKEPSQGG